MGAVGVDAARDGEGGTIELKDGDVAELVAIGIEELVVVDVVVLTENPLAVGAQVSLRRLAFDLIVQRFLALVGVGQIELVGEEQSYCQRRSGHDHRRDDAVDAGSSGLDGGNFVGPLHHAKRDQHGEQHDQRSHIVKQIGRDVEQVLRDDGGRNLVAKNVSQKFEQGKHNDEDEEGGKDKSEVDEEVAQDVVIDQSRKGGAEHAAPGGGAFKGVFAAATGDQLGAGRISLPECPE